MKSIHQKAEGQQREAGTGTVKVYSTGIVGYQPSGQSHQEYAEAMKPLRGITPANGDMLISRHFGKK